MIYYNYDTEQKGLMRYMKKPTFKIFYYNSEEDRQNRSYRIRYKKVRAKNKTKAVEKFKSKFPNLIFAFTEY